MTITTQTPGQQWTVPSRSQPGTLHVIKRVDGVLSCSCLGFIHRGRCAHVTALSDYVFALEAAAQTSAVSQAATMGATLLLTKRAAAY